MKKLVGRETGTTHINHLGLNRNILSSAFIHVYANRAFLLVLRFTIPVNSFSVMSEQSYCFLGVNQYYEDLMCLAQGHNQSLVGTEPLNQFRIQQTKH